MFVLVAFAVPAEARGVSQATREYEGTTMTEEKSPTAIAIEAIRREEREVCLQIVKDMLDHWDRRCHSDDSYRFGCMDVCRDLIERISERGNKQ